MRNPVAVAVVVMIIIAARSAGAQTPGNVIHPTAVENWRDSRNACGVELSWSPGTNQDGIVIVRAVGSPPDTTPTNGTALAVGTTLGNATVVYSDNNWRSQSTTRFRDSPAAGSVGDVLFYKLYAHNAALVYASGAVPDSSGVKVVRKCNGPDNSWQYAMGAASLAAPAVRTGAAGGPYAPSNQGLATSLKAAGGEERFRPVDLGSKVANRFGVLGIGDGTVMRAFAGAQDGYAHSINADTGAIVWSVNLANDVGDQITASPNIQLRSRSNAQYQSTFAGDLAIFATRCLSPTANKVVALDAATGGAPLWTYQPGDLDMITAQPVLNTATNRLFLASFSHGNTQVSVRAINTLDGTELWRSSLKADVEASPSLSAGVLVVGTRTGHMVALNADTGATVWDLDLSLPTATFGSTIFRPMGGRILFTTQQGGIHMVQDHGSSATELWRRPLSGPSSVVHAGLEIAWVGSSDGMLHEFSLADGSDVSTLALGAAGSSVGSPAVDSSARRLYVGTIGGSLYSLRLPLLSNALCTNTPETCDGFDNDCDGTADNGLLCVLGQHASCNTTCGSTGISTCDATCSHGSCQVLQEDCNGVDDDCDGVIDNGFQCTGTRTRSCAMLDGKPGTHACLASTCGYRPCAPLPPESRITVAPANPSSGDATLEFECTDPPCTFECSLNGTPFKSCSSPLTYPGLPPWSFVFKVQAIGASGATEPKPDVARWTNAFTAVQVDTHLEVACALTDTMDVKCWGLGWNGELGNGMMECSGTPMDVALDIPALLVETGLGFACVVTAAGGVKCWGDGYRGKLGNGNAGFQYVPADVTGLPNSVVDLDLGAYHACAVLSSGVVKCWGWNAYGQLGNGSTQDATLPVSVVGLPPGITRVACGNGHSCAFTASGAASCWGRGNNGQLGDGYTSNRNTAVAVAGLTSGVSGLALGETHTCALHDPGTGVRVKCWGDNTMGKLGDGTFNNRLTPALALLPPGATHVSVGTNHSCAVLADSTVHCWGQGAQGRLGHGSTTSSRTPVTVTGLSGVTSLSVGDAHALAVTGGSIRFWGHNRYGLAGQGNLSNKNRHTPVSGLVNNTVHVAGGADHACAVLNTGGVRCWGEGGYAMGAGTTWVSPIPVDVSPLPEPMTRVAAGAYHTCAVAQSGSVMCWGLAGRLGNGGSGNSATPVPVMDISTAVDVVAGWDHTCALLQGGGLKCWGLNPEGQLGDGSHNHAPTPVDVQGLGSGVISVSAGFEHTCAVTQDGAVWCWGSNEFGALGPGSSTAVPVRVQGAESGFSQVVAGIYFTCSTGSAGTRCWGGNGFGQIGAGLNNDDMHTPTDVAGLGSAVVTMGTAQSSMIAITTTHGLRVWGSNMEGQLGDGGESINRIAGGAPYVTQGFAMIGHSLGLFTCAITPSGTTMCAGSNQFGEIGDGTGWFTTPSPSVVGTP